MIKVKKDKIEKTVTKGAYENYYKRLGFEIVDEKPKAVVKEATFVEKKKEEDVVPPMKDDKQELEDFILNELKADKPKDKKGSK